jgi:hypothetical protein
MNDISKTIEYADKSWSPITGCLNTCPSDLKAVRYFLMGLSLASSESLQGYS